MDVKDQPVAEVVVPGKDPVTYTALTAEKVKVIVEKHILGGEPVTEYIVK